MKYAQQIAIDPFKAPRPEEYYKSKVFCSLIDELKYDLYAKELEIEEIIEKIETADGHVFRAELYVFTRKELKEFADKIRAGK